MRVYLVLHSDDEGGYIIRGVYATEALAEQALTVHEAHLPTNGRVWFMPHDRWCCSVDEMDVEADVELPYHGPPVPPSQKAEWHIVPDRFVDQMIAQLARRSPYEPLGRVVEAKADEGGIRVIAQLEPTDHSTYDWTKPLGDGKR